MDLTTLLYIYGAITVVLLILLLGGKWLVFGMKLLIAKMKYKENLGLLFFQNLAGNIGMPIPVNISAGKYTVKDKKNKIDKDYFFTREAFNRQSTFFGLPFIIFSQDDALTTAGIYFQQNSLDDNGKPTALYLEGDDKQISPFLKPIKPSIQLPPDMFKAAAISQNLKQILSEVLLQYKTVFLIVAGIGIGIGIMLFLQYNMVSETLPALQTIMEQTLSAAQECKLTPGVQ